MGDCARNRAVQEHASLPESQAHGASGHMENKERRTRHIYEKCV